MSTSSAWSIHGHHSDYAPEPINNTSHNSEPLLSGDEPNGLTVSRSSFLADLFRPHVRDYESMNLVLDHLGTFCDNALMEIRFNGSHNLGLSPDQMFQHCYRRLTTLWPLDERVNLDLREAVHKFDWRAFWNAIIEERLRIRQYQNDRDIYGRNRRSGSQRWVIISAAFANLDAYTFGLDLLRYLEPIATMQAFQSEFNFSIVEHEIGDEDMHWFSRSFFRHWDQAFQVLKARHPDRYRNDAHHILNAFVRQGVNVVDVFLKYWYQGSEDAPGDDFGSACERAGRAAVDRQWEVELDSPFASAGAEPLPLNIRTILARAENTRSRTTLFNTVACLAETVERDNMHRKLFELILDSVKDWGTVTGNEQIANDMIKAVSDNEKTPDNPTDADIDVKGPCSFDHVPYGSLNARPLDIPPLILMYDLPEELPPALPEPSDGDSIHPSQGDEVSWEEYTVNQIHPNWIRRFLHRLNPFSSPTYTSPFELTDVPLEAYGPRISPQSNSHTCVPPKGDICVICLDAIVEEQAIEKGSTGPKQEGKTHFVLRHPPMAILRGRRKAAKQEKNMRSMQLNACSHVFHRGCLDELLNQAYPKTGSVLCPCCRAAICAARPTRVARSRLGRVPAIGRLARR